jgi:hypothetical protein
MVSGFRSHGGNGEAFSFYHDGDRRQMWDSNGSVTFENGSNVPQMYIGPTGKVGINTSSPATVTGGIHAVHNASEGTPTAIGDEVGILQRNFNSAQSVALSLISGTASTSSIYFGDKDDIDVGKLAWSNSSNSFSFNGDTSFSGKIIALAHGAEGGHLTLRAQSGGAKQYGLDVDSTNNFRLIGQDDSTSANGFVILMSDASGNIMIGGSNSRPAEFSHPKGISFRGDIGQGQFSTDGQIPLILNRDTNDGDIIYGLREGAVAIRLGGYGGAGYIGSALGGIMFNGTDIEPTTGASARSNNTISLGSDNYKFRDGKFANEVKAGIISAGWHSWGTSQAIFGQDRYNIRELNNLFYSANTRFSGHGTSSNVHAAMFNGNFDSGYTFAANTTTVVEIDSGYSLTYPAGQHYISFYHVYNQFTSISIQQYHSAGTYSGQWRACGTATDFRGSAGSGGRVLRIEGAGNNYVRKWRMTVVTGSTSVNVTDWSHYLTRAAGADNREYMPNHVGAQVTHSMTFRNSAKTVVGSIGVSNTATAFNQTSDYRLKENVTPITSAAESVKLLNPVKFNFIEDETNTLIDGFLAHEVSSIVPEAVTGEKDAVEPDELYLESDPLPEGVSIGDVKIAGGAVDPQQLDYTKLIPMLTAALQEALARIEVLENQ